MILLKWSIYNWTFLLILYSDPSRLLIWEGKNVLLAAVKSSVSWDFHSFIGLPNRWHYVIFRNNFLNPVCLGAVCFYFFPPMIPEKVTPLTVSILLIFILQQTLVASAFAQGSWPRSIYTGSIPLWLNSLEEEIRSDLATTRYLCLKIRVLICLALALSWFLTQKYSALFLTTVCRSSSGSYFKKWRHHPTSCLS